ncbi:MAG: transporter [Sphingomonas taxi]
MVAATPSTRIAPSSIESVGTRPADRDRPPEVAVLGSEGSVVTRKGQLTGEIQFDYARADRNRALFRGIEIVESVLVGEFNINESRQDIITGSLAARYGVTDRLELGVRVPFVQRWDTSVLVPVQGSTNNDAAREIDSSTRGRGIGDIEMSARYQILTGRRGLPYLVGNLQVVAPTGTDPFAVPRLSTGEATRAATGAGFWGVSPSLTAILPSDPAVLFGTIGYTRNFGKSVDTQIPPVRINYVKPGDALSFSAGIGISLNERTSINLGYAHTWAFGTRTRTSLITPGPNDPGFFESTSRDLQLARLLFGVTYRATDRASINWSVEVGATDDASDVRTVLRVPLVLITPK